MERTLSYRKNNPFSFYKIFYKIFFENETM